jgi:hypothetical protein
MNFKNVRVSLKFRAISRYHPWKSSQPPTFPYPNNPWDNLDPGRMDKNVIDDFDR